MQSRAAGIHGLAEEGEDIRVHVVSREQAYAWLKEGASTTPPPSSPCSGWPSTTANCGPAGWRGAEVAPVQARVRVPCVRLDHCAAGPPFMDPD